MYDRTMYDEEQGHDAPTCPECGCYKTDVGSWFEDWVCEECETLDKMQDDMEDFE